MTQNLIHRDLLSDQQRIDLPAELFGAAAFPFKVEPAIFDMAGTLSAEYQGGYWDMHQLSNGGWYMSPASKTIYTVSSMNGFTGKVSGDALGITACLFAFSHLSFGRDALAEVCAEQYHLLREFAMDHAEAMAISAASD
jgi:hypothetical protein